MSGPNEKEYPLDVYRLHSVRGWEKQVPLHSVKDHNFGPNATGIPKAGCIVIRRFRLKISLLVRNNEMMHNGEIHRSTAEEFLMEVVRRRDCLLLTSKNRIRAIVLKFPSVRDCIDFSDQLLLVNREFFEISPGPAKVPPSTDGTAGEKSLREMVLEDESSSEDNTNEGVVTDPLAMEIQRNEISSLIARSLLDKNFQSFFNKIQDVVEADPALPKILLAAWK